MPWDYETLWWGGVPYYYTGDNYYLWDGEAGEYEGVRPPPQVTQEAAAEPQQQTELFAYPAKGQSAQQQASDKEQCRSWGRGQTGYDPADTGSTAAPGSASADSGETVPAAPAGAAGSPPDGVTTYGTAPDADSAAQARLNARSAYLRAEAACLEARGYTVR